MERAFESQRENEDENGEFTNKTMEKDTENVEQLLIIKQMKFDS